MRCGRRMGWLAMQRHNALIAAALPLALMGCGLLFPAVPEDATPEGPRVTLNAGASEAIRDLSGGLGTLRQNEVSVTLRRGELQIRVTPLDESVILVTAPDTYERLSALGRGHQEIFAERTGSAVPFQLFLVSLFSESTEVAFEPEALTLVNRGLRYRPAEIRAVTPGWGLPAAHSATGPDGGLRVPP